MKNRVLVAALAAIALSLTGAAAANADGSVKDCGQNNYDTYGQSCDGWIVHITNTSASELKYNEDASKRVHTSPGNIPAAVPGVTPQPNTLTRGFMWTRGVPDDLKKLVFDSDDLAPGWQRIIKIETHSTWNGTVTGVTHGVTNDGGQSVSVTVGSSLVQHPRPYGGGTLGITKIAFRELEAGPWKK